MCQHSANTAMAKAKHACAWFLKPVGSMVNSIGEYATVRFSCFSFSWVTCSRSTTLRIASGRLLKNPSCATYSNSATLVVATFVAGRATADCSTTRLASRTSFSGTWYVKDWNSGVCCSWWYSATLPWLPVTGLTTADKVPAVLTSDQPTRSRLVLAAISFTLLSRLVCDSNAHIPWLLCYAPVLLCHVLRLPRGYFISALWLSNKRNKLSSSLGCCPPSSTLPCPIHTTCASCSAGCWYKNSKGEREIWSLKVEIFTFLASFTKIRSFIFIFQIHAWES